MPVRQVLETDVEALVRRPVARATGTHVRLHTHQQHGIEAFGLAIRRIDLALLLGGTPGQRPGGVTHQHGRYTVGMNQAAPARRHAPEAVAVETMLGGRRCADDLSGPPGQTGIFWRAKAAPGPAPRGE